MFKLDEFQECESYQEKIDYAKSKLELVAEGKTRIVFAMDEDSVLKVAKNEKGLIQNNVEHHFSGKGWDRLAKVIEYDDDFMWLISERLEPVDEKVFYRKYGFNMELLQAALYEETVSKIEIKLLDENKPQTSGVSNIVSELFTEKKKAIEKAVNSEIYEEIVEKSKELSFDTSDIARMEHWGLRKGDKDVFFVILDYGAFDNRFRKVPLRNQD